MGLDSGEKGSLFFANKRDLNYCNQIVVTDCGKVLSSKNGMAVFLVPYAHP